MAERGKEEVTRCDVHGFKGGKCVIVAGGIEQTAADGGVDLPQVCFRPPKGSLRTAMMKTEYLLLAKGCSHFAWIEFLRTTPSQPEELRNDAKLLMPSMKQPPV